LKPKNRFHIKFNSRLGIHIHEPIKGSELAGLQDREIVDRVRSVIESGTPSSMEDEKEAQQ
jgi:hypothetical protein